ncbi:MAG: hypothetical protein FJZ95_05455 [Chloroflexi bacterium]|nr:hypothetical protein [Chloroflexota bacterium]
MKRLSEVRWGVRELAPLLVLVLAAISCIPAAARAEGGIAISGSFYRQDFELPQGASISGPSIDVVVFNNSSENLSVRMLTEAPQGVNIVLSSQDFTIAPGGQQKVLVEVQATEDAVPGTYELAITAESFKTAQGGGLQVLGAAGQTASVTVVGESARVMVQTRSPDGDPVVSVIRLFKQIGNELHEFAFTDTGLLEARVSPGNFLASAYIGDQKLTEKTFNVGANEEKSVDLEVSTIYFSGFGAVPYYGSDGKLGFAKLVYTIKNVYQPVESPEVVVLVTRDGVSQESIPVASMTTLGIGAVELSYSYVPSEGWTDGRYGFKLRLDLEGKPYANSIEQFLDVAGTAASSDTVGKSETNVPLVVGGVCGALVLAIGARYLLMRRRRARNARRANKTSGS